MDEAPLVSGRGTRADDGGRRQIGVGLDGEFQNVDELRNEDTVERQDDGVVVFDVRREVVITGFGRMMMILEVRVRDQVIAVGPFGTVHVLHRGQRKGGQGGDETQRDRARDEHYTGMLWDRRWGSN